MCNTLYHGLSLDQHFWNMLYPGVQAEDPQVCTRPFLRSYQLRLGQNSLLFHRGKVSRSSTFNTIVQNKMVKVPTDLWIRFQITTVELIGSVTSLYPGLSVCRLVGLSFCQNFLKGWDLSLLCSYRSTCNLY